MIAPSAPREGAVGTCLVTGASSGLGAEIAKQLARSGRAVTLVARREDRLRWLADSLAQDYNIRVDVVACDLSEPEQRRYLVAEVARRRLQVEVLINDAGVGKAGRFPTPDTGVQLQLVRMNIEAMVDLCGVYVPQMVDGKQGAVLNVASLAAFAPIPHQATYGATKAFVLNFTEALREELKGTGVSVTALCPGPMRTEFLEIAGLAESAARVPAPLWRLIPSAEATARAGVRGMERGHRRVIPGAANRATATLFRLLPRGLLLPALRHIEPSRASSR
ncbi:MAG: SDR family NAD(P)-dependent oxidoreductase [Solirubrobacterales bacterium]